MFSLLYQFFNNVVFALDNTIDAGFYSRMRSTTFDIGGVSYTFQNYLCTLCTIISMVFILVLCCLFIWKIIKLVGGLIR